MKYLCEACERLVLPASVRVEGGGLVMVCSRCSAETRMATQVAAPPEPASPPEAPSEPAATQPTLPPAAPSFEERLLAQMAATEAAVSTTPKPNFNDSEFLRLEFPATWLDKPVRVERPAEEPPPPDAPPPDAPPPAEPPAAAPPPVALPPEALEVQQLLVDEEDDDPEVSAPEAIDPTDLMEQTRPMQVSPELLRDASPPPPLDQTQPVLLTPELLRAAMPAPAEPPSSSSADVPWREDKASPREQARAGERLAPVVVLPLTVPAAPAAVDEPPSGPLAPVVQFPGARAESSEEPAAAPLKLPLENMLGDPFMPPQGYCPKCIAIRRAGAQACPQCGLVFARFKAEEHRPSAPVSAAWKLALSRWEDKEAHDRLMSLALEREELADVGRLYRIRLALNPDDPMAWRGRDEVLRLAATATGAFTPSQRISSASRAKVAVVALLIGLGLTMALLLG